MISFYTALNILNDYKKKNNVPGSKCELDDIQREAQKLDPKGKNGHMWRLYAAAFYEVQK